MTTPLLNPTAPAADSKSTARAAYGFSRPILIQLLSILILLREAGGF